jgi:hypothetical protein
LRTSSLLVACFSFAALVGTAGAQPAATPPKDNDSKAAPADGKAPARAPREGGAPRGQQLSPEKAKAAWEVEATGVAKRQSLGDAETKALVKAYAEARDSHQAASTKLREDMMSKGTGGGPEAMAEIRTAMEDLAKSERTKFEKALAGSLKAEQINKVSASLSTFSRMWDPIADAIAGLKLDAEKQQAALNAVEDFVVEQSKIQARGGSADVNREALRTAMQDARKNLDEALAKSLTPEQVKSLEGVLRPGRGMGGPGGPGGRQGGNPDGPKKPEGEKKPEGGK